MQFVSQIDSKKIDSSWLREDSAGRSKPLNRADVRQPLYLEILTSRTIATRPYKIPCTLPKRLLPPS